MEAAKPPTPQPLFRSEVLEAQHTPLLGQIILVPRPRMAWLAAGSLLAAVAVICFLVFGSYTRRATVTGQLVPASGVIRIHTPQAGVVLEKHVAEGQAVRAGDVLYVLSSDRPGLDRRELQAGIGEQVGERRRSMEQEIAHNRAVEAGEVGFLERRAAALRAEGDAIARQVEQQKQRLKLAEDARARYQGLADKEYIAREQLFQKEMELSEQQSRMQALQRDALANQRELAGTLRDIAATRARYASQNAALERGISSAEQELAEVEGRRRVVVAAPQAGRATLVSAEVGQSVDAARPLVNLVPLDARLEARLYAASRLVGFLRPGQPVLLRYQAFPFEKFGHYEGTVVSISQFAVPATELAGFSIPDLPAGEPVYAITVRLKEQSVRAFGEARPLAAGMRLDADVLQETRRLYEWALEPLYSVTGKM